jgi:hypothetical protein
LQPFERLIRGITGQKPPEILEGPPSEEPATLQAASKVRLFPKSNGLTGQKSRLYPRLAESPDQDQKTQLEILRRRVAEYWVDGVLRHSLHNEVLLSLGKQSYDQAVDAPWRYTVELRGSAPTPLESQDVSAIYDVAGLLLILGEPGSGKTTTLLDLAATLLDRARQDITERVPVVLNLSSWKRKQPLAEWMSNELSEKYRVPRKIGLFRLQRGYLIPLLDGLDEVETLMRPDYVAAINAYIEASNPSGLVVWCRLNEYRWLPKRLKLNGAICLEPLSKVEVNEYLASGGIK